MTKNIIKLNLSDELTKAEELFKSIKLDTFRLLAITKLGMLSYTDLLRSYADAVDDDADNVESIVLICLPYDK
jgi:hypothetical protein